MKKIILCILIASTFSIFISAQTLTIKISGIRNSKGDIRLAFFKTEKSFRNENPAFEKVIKKPSLKDGCITVKYSDIKSGTYGIALLDDENRNGEMDYRFFVPTEGFGFSNYFHRGMKKPRLNYFSFNFGKYDKTISIKVKYM